MRRINVVIFEGNLGSDPKKVAFANGGCITTFSVCGSGGASKDQATGEWSDKPVWMNVKVKGGDKNKQADFCNANLKKGMRVVIEGHLETEEWESKTDGKKQSRVILVVDANETVQMLEPKKPQAEQAAQPGDEPAVEEEIPF